MTTWAAIFDRAADYDRDVADVRAELTVRRDSDGDRHGGGTYGHDNTTDGVSGDAEPSDDG